ncbi:DUF1641 domain-containing protein [Cuniculiplasma divulgatum]|jgi:uncharacterized protein YjgD (DUF1641 family)|uniref:DUF1641 domain-containing protein n=1 Tax=Cuniculiplasma divulgatum TaxID=1673428 RepID=A0A1N5WJ75_9ARCH|nr:DUF1641 domain-containing protein [Cuniculiplasma divulgatum]MCI2412845.1 DUF1641 domain-containing protein [Cuniculiplasma sp.]OWP55752.1 MAG: hypothetical protein B2I18_01040 [Cuniculiplasma sp. C_DKE]WMT49933.1 MAG: DUF1641 domain-containing protein [Thermoplasmatales archaeon]SIM85301.1 hypothetical protein CSP5_1860 [Cuniculiplasma divulgatum]SJK85578.1 hypothetical protein CPM_1799 [Cuniculiplasma divulgatum]
MSTDIGEMLNEKLNNPESRKAVEYLLENAGTLSGIVEWIKTMEDTGMAESLKGLIYLVANMRGILTDDMLNGISTILNSLLEILAKVSDPHIADSMVGLIDDISSGKLSKEPKIHGTLSLLGELKDPEVESGLAVTINMLKILGKLGRS